MKLRFPISSSKIKFNNIKLIYGAPDCNNSISTNKSNNCITELKSQRMYTQRSGSSNNVLALHFFQERNLQFKKQKLVINIYNKTCYQLMQDVTKFT